MKAPRLRSVLWVVPMLVVAGCLGGTEPRVVILNNIELIGDAQVAPAGTLLPAPIVVVITDIDNRPVRGVRIAWDLFGGSGSFSETLSLTDANGRAQVRWTLGTTPGHYLARARVDEPNVLLSVEFGATAE
jgi:hypothetical protein